jgi:hypothetical protein
MLSIKVSRDKNRVAMVGFMCKGEILYMVIGKSFKRQE